MAVRNPLDVLERKEPEMVSRADQVKAWSEKELQSQVVAQAKALGWMVYHTHDSRRSEPGFPDLVLVHARHGVLFRELKRASGRVSAAQKAWLAGLEAAGADAAVWWPEEFCSGLITGELQGKGARRA